MARRHLHHWGSVAAWGFRGNHRKQRRERVSRRVIGWEKKKRPGEESSGFAVSGMQEFASEA